MTLDQADLTPLFDIPGSIARPMSQLIPHTVGEYKRLEGENAALREALAALTSRITMTISEDS